MRRPEIISLLCLAATVWQPAAHAQQPPSPVIGFLGAVSADKYTIRLEAFRQGLKDLGFVEGQNVTVEYRWAEGQNERATAIDPVALGRGPKRSVAGDGGRSGASSGRGDCCDQHSGGDKGRADHQP
jgi:hypothetical protein